MKVRIYVDDTGLANEAKYAYPDPTYGLEVLAISREAVMALVEYLDNNPHWNEVILDWSQE